MDQVNRRTVYALKFPHHRLLVRVRKPSLRGLLLLRRVVAVLGQDLSGEHEFSEDKLDAWADLADAFADSLVSWDLRDFGRPVPATQDGVFGQDLTFVIELATTWYRRVALASEAPAESERREVPSEPAQPAPSVEELALLNIPVEIGNGALRSEPVVGDQPESAELVEASA